MDLLKHAYYINLAHRTDRRERMETHLKELGIKAQRIDAVLNKECGAIGCYESHIQCLQFAKELKFPQICILEDDFLCTDPKLFKTQVEKFHKSGIQWDVILLGANVLCWRRENEFCNRVVQAFSAIAYIVHENYYDVILQNLNQGLEKLRAEPLRISELALDVNWNELQQKDMWWVIRPLTINQKPDFSDIQHVQVDYTDEMLRDEV